MYSMGFRSVFVCCVVALVCVEAQDVKLYDAYYGKPVTDKRSTYLASITNGTLLCTVPVRSCNKDEGRRVDGTCTNPHHPSRGATLTPFPRLLPAHFGIGNTLRPASDGAPLPNARHLRTTLLADGLFTEKHLSTLLLDALVFYFVDSVDLFYLLRYVVVSDCCINDQVPNVAKPQCIPIMVQPDDPYLRRTNIRCMNLTRVETYQEYGCIPVTMPAERYNRNTPLLDLSIVYGYTEEKSRSIRANTGGLLAFRMEGDREVPLGQSPWCINNKPENLEVSCYLFGDDFQGNLLPGIVLGALWFFREHNRLARELAKINPCWDDQTLFETARKINIAQYQYIFYYEVIPEILGYKNALHSGIIFETKGHVNDFDPKYEPGVYREYMIGSRWFHALQPSFTDLYKDKKYVGSRTLVDDMLRTGIYAVNNTEADVTFSGLVQPTELDDFVVSHDISNRVFGENQAAADAPSIDIMRGRDAGLPPYTHYRKFCGLKADDFHDFLDWIDEDKVEFLSRLYQEVDDVDLMTGIYMERSVPGSFVGPTLHCIMTHNYLLWRKSDKFFFEHGGFHAALTERQLKEVRKTGMARILCDNGAQVEHIQKYPFLLAMSGNEVVPCEKIHGMDLTAWKDHKCIHRKK